MTGVSRCTDHNCPSREDCARFTLEPQGKERIFYKSPRSKKKKLCDFFTKRSLNKMERENTHG